MANAEGVARSNYFKVKAETYEEFEEWCRQRHFKIGEGSDEEQGMVMIHPDPDWYVDNGPCWPTSEYNEETDEDEEIDVVSELSQFLEDDSIAVVQQSVHEKLRYISAYATAVNSKGDTLHVDLYDMMCEKINVAKRVSPDWAGTMGSWDY